MAASTRAPQRHRAREQGISKTPAPAITLSESDGVRYLHFGTPWVQGAMRLSRPFALELEYQQQMMAAALLQPQPQRIVLLGLGAAALAKFCWRHCTRAQVVVVELEPGVVDVARQWFQLPPDDEHLSVVLDDARNYINAPAQRQDADWLLVDLYDSAARGPVYDDADFYAACRSALRESGVAAFNLFGHRFAPSFERICTAFDGHVVALPDTEAGNRIVLGYRGKNFNAAWRAMAQHAQQLQTLWRLPFVRWVKALETRTLEKQGEGHALTAARKPKTDRECLGNLA